MAPDPVANHGGFAPTSSRYQKGNTHQLTMSWGKRPVMDREGLLPEGLCNVSLAHPIKYHTQGCMQRAGLIRDCLE